MRGMIPARHYGRTSAFLIRAREYIHDRGAARISARAIHKAPIRALGGSPGLAQLSAAEWPFLFHGPDSFVACTGDVLTEAEAARARPLKPGGMRVDTPEGTKNRPDPERCRLVGISAVIIAIRMAKRHVGLIV